MSHFTVMVRLPASVPFDDVQERVKEMLLPYKESGCGDEDPPELRKHLEFKDEEDDHRKQYEEDTTDVFVDPAGKLHCKYSDQFRWNPPGYIGTGSSTEYRCPIGWTARLAKHSELYPTFEGFMADYCGYKARDPEKGRYGHWSNPNQKWDWWLIGGRWTGFFPLRVDPYDRQSQREMEAGTGRPGTMTRENRDVTKADYCRIAGIDFDKVAADSRAAMEKFWAEWVRFCDGEKFDHFDGPRQKALSLGFVDCKNADELTGAEWKTVKWERQNLPGVDRFDVLKFVSREDFVAKYGAAFNDLKPWATLDAEGGWQEPGKMGWWACSSDTPETYMAHVDRFMGWLRGGDQRDWVVAVDCHI